MPTDQGPPRGLVLLGRGLGGALGFLVSGLCQANFYGLEPYVSVSAREDSNVLRVADDAEAILLTGDSEMSDTILVYEAGLAWERTFSRQRLFLDGEARNNDYQNFSNLDNDEYGLGVGLDWVTGSAVSGLLQYRQEERAQPFEDRASNDVVLETEDTLSGSLQVDLSPRWRLVSTIADKSLEAPQPGLPGFGLEETNYQAGIQYLGVDRLTMGLLAEVLDGEFIGLPVQNTFTQTTGEVTLDYAISAVSSVESALGYTSRDETIDSVEQGGFSGFTGSLGHTRALSFKTDVAFTAFRNVQSYNVDSSFLVDTGATLALNWRPTFRTEVVIAVQASRSEFETAGTVGLVTANREDDNQSASLGLIYRPRPWLSTRLDLAHESRDSSVRDFEYEADIIGITVEARFEE